MRSLWNNLVVSGLAVSLSLIVGVPAAYALGRYQFKGREDIAFTFLSFRFAPEILVIIPLYLIYQKLGLIDSFFGLDLGLSAYKPSAADLDSSRILRRYLAGHRRCGAA